MKIAVLSDIHGNLEALEAVNLDLRQRGVDRVFCLGDNIGYGPDPEAVIQLVRRQGYTAILGNHELALRDEKARKWFNFQAAENNIATAKLLSPASLAYCDALPKYFEFCGARFVHGFPPDSVLQYLSRQSDEKLATFLADTALSLFFLGHTHTLEIVGLKGGAIRRQPLKQGRVILIRGQKYIVNAGSVGQPRESDKRAKYLLWDNEAGTLDTMFVAYDCRRTMEKIRDLGFPESYALRLG
jgi:predicted phosphodiesterase